MSFYGIFYIGRLSRFSHEHPSPCHTPLRDLQPTSFRQFSDSIDTILRIFASGRHLDHSGSAYSDPLSACRI